MVEGNPAWKARVVYGDTDSLFVLVPGRTRAEAFKIGAEIAAQATAANPAPVTLKMEKARSLCGVWFSGSVSRITNLQPTAALQQP